MLRKTNLIFQPNLVLILCYSEVFSVEVEHLIESCHSEYRDCCRLVTIVDLRLFSLRFQREA